MCVNLQAKLEGSGELILIGMFIVYIKKEKKKRWEKEIFLQKRERKRGKKNGL